MNEYKKTEVLTIIKRIKTRRKTSFNEVKRKNIKKALSNEQKVWDSLKNEMNLKAFWDICVIEV